MSKVEDGFVVKGLVKWFNSGKGFGFMTAEGVEGDILLHGNVLRNYGQSSVADQTPITARVRHNDRGFQVIEVLDLERPVVEGGFEKPDQVHLSDAELAELSFQPARVKWYSESKGFGFVNIFGRPEDVFVHANVVKTSGFSVLDAGEAICIRVVNGGRGAMAVQISAWETATRAPVGADVILYS